MSQATLEAALAEARTDLLNGSTLSTGGGTDSTFGFQVQMTPKQRIELILEELSILDPVTYPPASVRPITVTLGVFRDQ